MLVFRMALPPLLAIFGISWYIHVVKLLGGKSEPMHPLLGIGLFYLPLYGILIPLFLSAGAATWMVVVALIVSTIISTFLLTSGVIKQLDGKAIIGFLMVNIGLFGCLWLLS